MRKFTIVLFNLLLTTLCFSQTDSILFIGNSYTYTSDLPNTLKSLAESAGKSIYVESYTPGGKQLNQHVIDPASIAKINSRNWKYVVLQEQSQMPLVNPTNTRQNAQSLVNTIKTNNLCTEPIIFMTWARQAGNSWLADIGWTHEQMAQYYETFYTGIFEFTTGRVSPVGTAFHEATTQGINVYSGDGSHQNTDGTYLAACVFYATIYKETPVGLTYSKASSTILKDQLQSIAATTVLPHLYDYNIDKIKFDLSANQINSGETITFTEWVYVYDYPPVFEWTFNGAETIQSSSANPSATYKTEGEFDVSLKITSACFTETRNLKDTIKVGSLVGFQSELKNSISVYPTISSKNEALFISSEHSMNQDNRKLYNTKGDAIPFKLNSNNQLSFNKQTGSYIITSNEGKKGSFIITE